MDNEKKEFIYTDSSDVEHKINLYPNSFKFAQKEKSIHDTKFLTKPTTFFKDAFKRFCKNKSSVAGGIILGTLLVLSVIIPAVLPNDLTRPHPEEVFLLPKLFPSGTGFWDGTERIESVPVDTSTLVTTEGGVQYGYPFENQYPRRSVIDRSPVRTGYVDSNQALSTAKGGFLNLVNSNVVDMSAEDPSYVVVNYTCPSYVYDLDTVYNLELEMLDDDVEEYPEGNFSISLTYNATLLSTGEENPPSEEEGTDTPVTYADQNSETGEGSDSEGESGDNAGEETPTEPEEGVITTEILSSSDTKEFERYNIQDEVNTSETMSIKKLVVEDLMSYIKNNEAIDFSKPISDIKISIGLDPNIGETSSIFVRSISLFEEGNEKPLAPVSWSDANANILLSPNSSGYWTCSGNRYIYHAIGYVCDITYDSYLDVYGDRVDIVNSTNMRNYVQNGWLDEAVLSDDVLQRWYASTLASGGQLINNPNSAYYEYYKAVNDEYQSFIKDSSLIPIIDILGVDRTSDENNNRVYTFTCTLSGYKLLNYTSMPIFLAGTDRYGYDLLKRVFEGLRNSLLIGIAVFAICFLFGLVYGAICGYFGGNIDILLQRFCDILSGVPRIVVMTLCILNLGSNFGTFILAMCMTGWIGTASLTRTQFYRFRDREYTLASRTLGASNFRLIFKHILPNAMGTIITSSVLMIPSVIFSEATISYLGLGFQDIQSLGVILSENQRYLSSDPYLILFPSAIMALIMISFNLFGNGLRDAFNPSLKGSD